MRKYLVSLVVCIGILSATAPASAQYMVIGAEQVEEWMTGSKKVTLIDVRMPEEYAAGHIPGAMNIPAERFKGEARRLPRDRAQPLIFYCRGAG